MTCLIDFQSSKLSWNSAEKVGVVRSHDRRHAGHDRFKKQPIRCSLFNAAERALPFAALGANDPG